MASTKDNRSKFIKSVMKLLETYDVDGIDLDWEYPVARKLISLHFLTLDQDIDIF